MGVWGGLGGCVGWSCGSGRVESEYFNLDSEELFLV